MTRIDTPAMLTPVSIQPESDPIPEWTDGDKLRKLRRRVGMNQATFAAALDVHPQTYAAWETDRNRVPDPRTIARKLKLLTGVPMWWFLDSEPPHGPGSPGEGVARPKGFEPPTSWSVGQRTATSIDTTRDLARVIPLRRRPAPMPLKVPA